MKRPQDFLTFYHGQSLAEYGLMLALVSVFCVGAITTLGSSVKGSMNTIVSDVSGDGAPPVVIGSGGSGSTSTGSTSTGSGSGSSGSTSSSDGTSTASDTTAGGSTGGSSTGGGSTTAGSTTRGGGQTTGDPLGELTGGSGDTPNEEFCAQHPNNRLCWGDGGGVTTAGFTTHNIGGGGTGPAVDN